MRNRMMIITLSVAFVLLLGMTISFAALSQSLDITYGNIKQALWYNPVVFLLAAGIGAAIVITIVDVIKHKGGLKMRDCYVYKLMHRQLPLWVVIISVSFALVNWVWNILKGL